MSYDPRYFGPFVALVINLSDAMSELKEQIDPGCGGKCPQCSAEQSSDGPSGPGGLVGWQFALVALIAFVVPMGFCVTSAVLARRYLGQESTQLLAALAALVFGVIIAGLIVRRLVPTQAREAK